MSSVSTIAEREWLAVSPDGTEHRLVLSVGGPQHKPRGEWTCAVTLWPLDSGTHEVAGMDSWQAVELAMQHIAYRIQAFQRLGWQFFWDANREPASPADLYKSVGASVS